MAESFDNNTEKEVLQHLALMSITDHQASVHSGGNDNNSNSNSNHDLHTFRTAPIFSLEIKKAIKDTAIFPMYGHLGMRLATYADGVEKLASIPRDNLLYTNINAPWSAFICGSQGAGKSHTLSCLLENALLNNGELGPNPKPLAGIIFHYDKHSGGENAQICEAAYLASQGIPVEVLVSATNFWDMEKYYHIPGIPDAYQPKVRPLLFQDSQVNLKSIMALMNVDTDDANPPLYIEMVNEILREMAIDAKGQDRFDHDVFVTKVNEADLTPSQRGFLNNRMKLLRSFLYKTAKVEMQSAAKDAFQLKPGTLTILDLSCSFVLEKHACMLFAICLSLFIRSRRSRGLIIALDEAHKFLTDTPAAAAFTEELLQTIRQQRHSASRVIIATQEPTLSPKLLDLCNVTIVHRFSSQAWYETLRTHLAALSARHANDDVLNRIVSLRDGEALMFCPTAYLDVNDAGGLGDLKPLRSSYIKMRVRKRLTEDGGRSIMAAGDEEKA